MSWSVTFVGNPAKIKEKLVAYGEQLQGVSKQEFEDAKPALDILLDQNVGENAVHLDASGHAYFEDGKKKYGSCHVNLKQLGILAT